jgi:dethiobiotin synthetase
VARLRGCFVTGTDTGVGKTVLAAAIVASLRSRGVAVQALKPVITGLAEPADPVWPHDHELLARVAGCHAEDVALVGYGPPVSPHLAAQLADGALGLEASHLAAQPADGEPLSVAWLSRAIHAASAPDSVLVVEGVGGLLVPLGPGADADVRSLAHDLGLPLVVAARPGLGTINHTLLTLEAARSVGLEVAAVVLTPWPAEPGLIERSNRKTIARLGSVEVATLGVVDRPEPDALIAAAAGLALDRWLALE